MNIKTLKRDELLILKEEVEQQLKLIDTVKNQKLAKDKNKLSGLTKKDKMFCFQFNGSWIGYMDYVSVEFYKKENDVVTSFSTSHDTKPMGLSSCIKDECMDNHYFLAETCGGYMYFYTLKPETWKEDLVSEMQRLTELKQYYFSEELQEFKDNIINVIGNPEVDVLIDNCK